MRGTYLAATAAALWASLAAYPAQAATVIATCGPSKGTAYFFRGSLMSSSHAEYGLLPNWMAPR